MKNRFTEEGRGDMLTVVVQSLDQDWEEKNLLSSALASTGSLRTKSGALVPRL